MKMRQYDTIWFVIFCTLNTCLYPISLLFNMLHYWSVSDNVHQTARRCPWLFYASIVKFVYEHYLVLPCFIRFSSAVNVILQKLCTVLGLLKDLLLIERLSDSCILQLVKTSITTFMVDNIQLLQLKAIGLLSAVLMPLSLIKLAECWLSCSFR